ncbi:MAG: response regulator [Bdellovibrionales bacterium]|nr:response regulator [Bdellovibrionales bacterium]
MKDDRTSVDRDGELNPLLLGGANRLIQAQRHAILLVEDTAAHAALIRRALDSATWEVEHVTRAASALQSFERDPDRIVLLDLSLPDSDGLKLLARLHQVRPDAPIIVVTATDQVSVSVEAMRRGAWDYVVKSDPKESGEQIIAAIERAWRQRVRAAERHLIEQARLAEMVRAERLEAIESIVRTLCSEVNNPLSGVMALSQLLQQKDELDEDMRRLAEGIAKSASQVAEVVRKLKDVSEEDVGLPPADGECLKNDSLLTFPADAACSSAEQGARLEGDALVSSKKGQA